MKGKQSVKSQVLGNQNSESEILLEGDDDIMSFMEEREVENLTGNFSYLNFLLTFFTVYVLICPASAVNRVLGRTLINCSFP